VLSEYIDLIKQYRRDLHQIPEIGFDLYKTSNYIKETLHSFGYLTEDVAETGVIAIKPGINKEAIAFRADMDALMVTEKTNVSFSSSHLGKMHACGHDGHMAILLGFSKYLAKLTLNKTVVLIFQPAEEGPGGAKVIIDQGVLDRYNIKSIFGLHLYPNLEEGKYGFTKGPMMAASGEFDIRIEGRSSHGAEPHLGSDAILASATLINNYHTIVSRYLDPLSPAVITIGTINGGEARNIIPGLVSLTGTIRSFDHEQYQYIKKRITEINKGIEIIHNLQVVCEIRDCYPAVINDDNLFDLIDKYLEKDEYQAIQKMIKTPALL